VLTTSTPQPVTLPPPLCSPMTTGQILCMGEVVNPSGSAVERVQVQVLAYSRWGVLLAEGVTSIEQGHIPAGGSAPYRLLLPVNWLDFGNAAVQVVSADSVRGPLVMMEIQGDTFQYAQGVYGVAAVVRNPAATPVRLVRAVLTLYDAQGRVVGYRIQPLGAVLGEGALVEVQMGAAAQAPAVTYRVFVEAVANG
jgi:hypothetical protein